MPAENPEHRDRSAVIGEICRMVEKDRASAARLVREKYPFAEGERFKRAYTPFESTQIFIRDGFIDRYSGKHLVFPGTLRVLSMCLPAEFPFHPNWRMDQTHLAFWELFPTIDHVHPIARGGKDCEVNWVTTSQLRNSAKANWTLAELQWRLVPAGDIADWDGLIRWFVDYVNRHREILSNSYLAKWYRAAEANLRS